MRTALYQKLKGYTEGLNYENANAAKLSQELKVSRSVVSQYLNEGYNSQELIKINTRPVIYFHRQILEDMLNRQINLYDFSSISCFQSYIEPYLRKDFDKLIGCHESLSFAVERCKASINYPPAGMPILLHGATGTGKSLLAQLIHEYCVNQNILEKGASFIILNCSEFANNPELLTANLFGNKKGAYTGADKDNEGLLKAAEGGILFLDEVHALTRECQEKLFLFMDKGMYHMLGDNEVWHKSNVRLIFATTEDPHQALLKTLLRRIPVIIDMPSLKEKSLHERIQLIYSMFYKESQLLKRTIKLHVHVYNILLTAEFAGNIGGLKNCIRAACVNALYRSEQQNQELEIRIHDLPHNLFDIQEIFRQNMLNMEENRLIGLEELNQFANTGNHPLKLHENLMMEYQRYLKVKQLPISFLEKALTCLEEYKDSIAVSEESKSNANFKYVSMILQQLLNIIIANHNLDISNNDRMMLIHYLYHYVDENLTISIPDVDRNIQDMKLLFENELPQEYLISNELGEYIKSMLGIELSDLAICIVTLYFHRFQHILGSSRRAAFILAHGYSTASSIADAANKLLGHHVFTALDMPLTVDTASMVTQLYKYLDRIDSYDEVVLLVDMGSLEDIYESLSKKCKVNVGIMNNVTLKMALDVGNGLIHDLKLEEIFEVVEENSVPVHHIIRYHQRERIIICTCVSGLGTAEKLKTILLKSLPETFPVKIVTYDYNDLLVGLQQGRLHQYEIICIVGTLNPDFKTYPFIPIEDLIIDVSLDKLHAVFSKYLSIHDLQIFKENILKNFSLLNLMNALSILNPATLLDQVSVCIDELQKLLRISFSNKVCVGLYVHVSCLIERLIIKEPITVYHSFANFEEQEDDFIKKVKKAFASLENYYNIVINIEEIGYLYDYISNDIADNNSVEE